MLPTAAVALTFAVLASPEAEVAALAALYQAYDLPLPPKYAKLYKFTRWPDAELGEKAEPQWVYLGFALTTDRNGKPTNALVGSEEEEWVISAATQTEELKPNADWVG